MNFVVILFITITITSCKSAPGPDADTEGVTLKRKPHFLSYMANTLSATGAFNSMEINLPYKLQNTVVEEAVDLFAEKSDELVKLIKDLDTIYQQNSVNTDELFKNADATVNSLPCNDTVVYVVNLLISTLLSTSKPCVNNVATIAVNVVETLRDYYPEISKIIKTSKIRVGVIMDDITAVVDLIPKTIEEVKTIIPDCDLAKVEKDAVNLLLLAETLVKKIRTKYL